MPKGITLKGLLNRLKLSKFYGKVTIHFNSGKVTHIIREESIKLEDIEDGS